MVTSVIKEDILSVLEQIQHPEIMASLTDLSMILDVGLDNSTHTVNIAIGLPVENIPQAVEKALTQNIDAVMYQLNLKTKIHFFDMPEEQRNKFFEIARAKWKHV